MKAAERAILVGVDTPGATWPAEESLTELAQLADTAGAAVVGRVVQKRERPDPACYLGAGKLVQVQVICAAEGAEVVICDDELTPAQARNMEKILDARVIDRTQLILDIFAQRATSREGKIQVELAQLRHLLPRLMGRGVELSRLGGSGGGVRGPIGARGPGESKLETDRRRIRKRIADLGRDLETVRRRRERQRQGRREAELPTVALVGYTNAGKSTLLNALTGAGVMAIDRLFATLDPTIRRMDVGGGGAVLLIDTVGFIQKLPHTLVAAFRATLEEAIHADVLVHVVDAAHPRAAEQADAVFEALEQLGAAGRPLITALNKTDRLAAAGDRWEAVTAVRRSVAHSPRCVEISALTGEGLTELKEEIKASLPEPTVTWRFAIPYDRAAALSWVHEHGRVLSEDFAPEGVLVRAEMRRSLASRLGWAKKGGQAGE